MLRKIKTANIYAQQAFTILELVVVAAITVTLTSFFIANFGGQNTPRELNAAKNLLVSDLRRAQSNSLISKNLPSGSIASEYGIVFDFNNSPLSYAYVGDDNTTNKNRSSISTINLPSKIYIKSASIARADGIITGASSLEILFTVPYGRVLQTYSGGSQSAIKDSNATVTITIGAYNDASLTRTIIIDGVTGNIY